MERIVIILCGNRYYQVEIGQRVEYVDSYAVLLLDKELDR
jgi:hypothetical protein